jgi:hypothetical protein
MLCLAVEDIKGLATENIVDRKFKYIKKGFQEGYKLSNCETRLHRHSLYSAHTAIKVPTCWITEQTRVGPSFLQTVSQTSQILQRES